MNFDYEVLIIGGGPAGLTAAMTLGRISRTALLCDDNRPRNAPSIHVNNFPTRDGIHPAEWRKQARQNLEKYTTIKSYEGTVTSIEKSGEGFKAQLSSGQNILIKKVILAYGIQDRLLPIPGFRELWGKSLFHCPFCHGFEIRGSRLGIIVNNEMAFHSMPMISSFAAGELLIFTEGKIQFSSGQLAVMKKNNVRLIETKIEELDRDGESLKAVVLSGGERIERDYLFYAAAFPFEMKSKIGDELGCEKNQMGLYKVNERGSTSIPGVFACGDNMMGAQSVLLASASGVTAGAGAIFELMQEGWGHGSSL